MSTLDILVNNRIVLTTSRKNDGQNMLQTTQHMVALEE